LHYNKRMKLRAIFVLTMGLLTAALSFGVVRAEQATTKTVWDGVFTAEQAERGAEAYKTACSECHGGDLMGDGFAPALSGADFQGNWNDLSVGDLFERIRISMPPSGPSSVTPEQKADIVAHLMNMNKYPAGTTELEPKTEALKTIKIELKKP
jgi:S-disulfanyl-L-cysteine oxidoreductase SoxD